MLRLEDRLEQTVYNFPPYNDSFPPGNALKKPTRLKTKERPYSKESRLGGVGSDISITTLPGERIIRSWMSLLVKVVRSLIYLKPFALRNPTISMVDYPSTNWYRSSENLVFHTGYCLVSYDLIEADEDTFYTFPQPKPDDPQPPPVPFPNIEKINIDSGETHQTKIDLTSLDQQQLSTQTIKTEKVVYVEPDEDVLLSRIENIFREIVVIDGGFF